MQLCKCANGVPFAHFHFSRLLNGGTNQDNFNHSAKTSTLAYHHIYIHLRIRISAHLLIYNPPLPGKTYQ